MQLVILILQSIVFAAHGEPVKSKRQVCEYSEKDKLIIAQTQAKGYKIHEKIDELRFTGTEIEVVKEIADMALRMFVVNTELQKLFRQGL